MNFNLQANLLAGIALMSQRRSTAIQRYTSLQDTIEACLDNEDFQGVDEAVAQQNFMEFELRCLGVEMTPEEIRGDDLTPDELIAGRWHERLAVGSLEFGNLDDEDLTFGWANDDGEVELVEFGQEMDNEWWEAQFNTDAGMKSVSDALPGEPTETTWHPNWEHLMKVAEKRDELRDNMLNRIDKTNDIKGLARGCQLVKKFSAWAMLLNQGKRIDAYNHPITNWGLDYRRFALVMNELFRKACQLKGHTKALEQMAHLVYTDSMLKADANEKAKRQALANNLNTWAKKALGPQFKCFPIMEYPERVSKEGDILDHAAQKGEHEMEDGDLTKALNISSEHLEAFEEYLAYRRRLDAIPENRSFRMNPDEVMDWMSTPLQSPLTQPLMDLFKAKGRTYIPPTPAQMGF